MISITVARYIYLRGVKGSIGREQGYLIFDIVQSHNWPVHINTGRPHLRFWGTEY